MLAAPEVVLAELEHASSVDGRNGDLADARQLLASLDKQLERLLRLHQMGDIDDAYVRRPFARDAPRPKRRLPG